MSETILSGRIRRLQICIHPSLPGMGRLIWFAIFEFAFFFHPPTLRPSHSVPRCPKVHTKYRHLLSLLRVNAARMSVDEGFNLDHLRSIGSSDTDAASNDIAARVERAFEILKSRPDSQKSALVHEHQNETSAALLESAVRTKLRTECRETISGTCNLFKWIEEETLEEFVNRVYKHSPESSSSQPININDARAKVLVKHARIEIQSTDKLSDHLYLYFGRGFKILYVFSDRGFLEDSLDSLVRPNSPDPISSITTMKALNQ